MILLAKLKQKRGHLDLFLFKRNRKENRKKFFIVKTLSNIANVNKILFEKQQMLF
jgi:hypothetical protein